jgi:PilZ domain
VGGHFRGFPLLPVLSIIILMDISPAVASERPVELRAAVRFPLCVPVTVTTESGDFQAITENISANGVLFELATPLLVGSLVSFTIAMPAEAMGTPTDVVLHCFGRVVRCTSDVKTTHVAAVIDKYHFSH